MIVDPSQMQRDVAEITLSEIFEGLEKSFHYRVSERDIDLFAEVSGDFSPLHMDGGFARERGYSDRVVHGVFMGALVSRLIGMILPGRDAVMQSIQLNFHRPTYSGYSIEVSGKVVRKLESLNAVQVGISVKQIVNQEVKNVLVSGKVQLGFTEIGGKLGDDS